jgi:hypothetical protein
MPEREEWARTRVRSSRHARRGAWYRVILATPLEATLVVNHQPLTVPRSFLQILPFRPRMWSVVARLRNAAHPPLAWGSTYGVCPSCSTRASLGQHALNLRCPGCNGVFPVAWADSAWCVYEGVGEARAARAARDQATQPP